MNLLVTGGAGYIGSVVTAQLLAAGHTVTIADDFSKGHDWAVPDEVTVARVDITDGPAIGRVVAGDTFDGVLHFAALALVAESVTQPVRYFHTNVGGTMNLLDAMRAAKVPRLVLSSTCATYGEPDEVPIKESARTSPTNPYGASKLAVDNAVSFECSATGLGAVSLRYFNVAGSSGDLGELHDPESHLIPLVLAAAAGLRDSVQIYGTDYPTPDGTAIRDYIHVEDLARAHLLALDAARPSEHIIFNLGNGAGFSVREVIEAARSVTGKTITAFEAGRRPGDPAVLVGSSEKIRRELGWVPEKPGLEQMIGDAWDWMTRNRHRY